MKKFIAATSIFFTLGFSAFANDKSYCTSLSEMAESFMRARQIEVPMSKLIEHAKGDPIIESVVVAAYNRPSFRTEQFAQREIAMFKNQVYMECFKIHGNK